MSPRLTHCKRSRASKIHLQSTISPSLLRLVTQIMRPRKTIALHSQVCLTPMRILPRKPSLPASPASTSRPYLTNYPHQPMAPLPANMRPPQPLCLLHPPSNLRSQPRPTYHPDRLRKKSPRRIPITIPMMTFGRFIPTVAIEALFNCSR